jgi:hypothetical protein
LTELRKYRQRLVKLAVIGDDENPFSGSGVVTCGPTDMRKIIREFL